MRLFFSQLEPLTEATKAALSADQINLLLVVMGLVVLGMVFQAWFYSSAINRLRGSVETGFNHARTDQRDGNSSVSKLAEAVETFSGRMVEITEGFAKRMNTLGQQMDAGFAATSTVIDGMRQHLEDADKTANLRNEQILKAVRDASDKVVGDVSRHVDTALDKLANAVAGSLDVSAAGVKDAVNGALESLLQRLDTRDETLAQMVAVWRDVQKALETLRGQMVGQDELASVVALLDELLTEVKKVNDAQPNLNMETAAGDVAGAAGGVNAADGHTSSVGRGEPADTSRDLVLDQYADGGSPAGERRAGGDLPDDSRQPDSVG